jgi:hypothetical protein
MDRRTTAYLGQFAPDRAQRIAERLDEEEILWWSKESGRLLQFLFAGDWGVRLFADTERFADAERIVADTPDGAD